MVGYLRAPEGVGQFGLSDTGRCQVGVGPGRGSVALFEGPVALPWVRTQKGWSGKEGDEHPKP